MRLTFFGGAGGNVIPSRILLDSTLLDCGNAIPKKRVPNYRANFGLLKPQEVKKILFSHGHTDHVDAICDFVQDGFNGGIESTRGTKEITEALLRDNHPKDLVDDVFELYKSPRKFLERFQIADKVYATFYPAQGHILGASSVLLEFEKENLRVLYSGDLGNINKNMLDVTGKVPEADIVIMESTYGRREHHPDFELSRKELYTEINKTYERGGNFHIPVLSINKLQEVLYNLNLGIEEKQIDKNLNIFVDTTLGEIITEIYSRKHNRGLFSNNARNYFSNYSTAHPFSYTDRIVEGGGNIILASSGLDGLMGRFRKYFKDLADEKNSVAVVSHTIEGSPLNDIASGKERIRTNGRSSVPLKAKSFTLSGFASHADATQLVNWLKKTKAKFVFLFHGEDDSRLNLKEMIVKEGVCLEDRIFTPALNEEFDPTNLPKAKNSCSVPNKITMPLKDDSNSKTMIIGGQEFPVEYRKPGKKK